MKKLIISTLFFVSLCMVTQSMHGQVTSPSTFQVDDTQTKSDTQISLTWVASPDADGYIILFNKETGTPSVVPADGDNLPVAIIGSDSGTLPIAGGTSTSTVVTNLTVATIYNFRLLAYKLTNPTQDTNEANYSAVLEVIATTLASTPEGAPSNLTFSQISANSVTLNFIASPDPNVKYLILRSTDTNDINNFTPQNGQGYTANSVVSVDVVSSDSDVLTFTDNNLSPSTTYYYKIYAYTGDLDSANYSNPIIGQTETQRLDMTSPIIQSITVSSELFSTQTVSQTITVTFDEPMDEEKSLVFLFDTQSINWTTTEPSTWTSNKSYTAVFGYSGNPYTGTITVSIVNPTDLADISTNPLNIELSTTSTTFEMDTNRPTTTITASPSIINKNNRKLQITASYSETMDQSIPPIFAFNPLNNNLVLNTGESSWTNVNEYMGVYDYSLSSSETINDISVNVSDAMDTAGNSQQQADTPYSFIIDTESPSASISYSEDRVKDGSTITITATMSEAIDSAKPLTISISFGGVNIVIPSEMQRVSSITYNYVFTPNTNGSNGMATVSLGNAQDQNGNIIDSIPNIGATFTIDNKAPQSSSLSPSNGISNISVSTSFSINFDEQVTPRDGVITIHHSDDDNIVETINVTSSNTAKNNFQFILEQDLVRGTEYYINIPNDLFVDLAGNAFVGFLTKTDWSFTTFSAPIVTSVAPSTILCVGSQITITGEFLIGVTEVYFGTTTTSGQGLVTAANGLIVVNSTELKVTVPSDAKNGNIILKKAQTTENPEAEVTFEVDSEIGPVSATLNFGDPKIENVCNDGSITEAPIKIDIIGGKPPYVVDYLIQASIAQNFTQNSYESGTNILINPHKTGENHTITIVSVKDANGCSAPQLTNNPVVIRENERPVVSAGGIESQEEGKPNEASVCLLSTDKSFTLNGALLGTNLPSHTGGGTGVVWNTNNGGTLSNENTLEPTYNFVNDDLVRGDVKLMVSSIGTPEGCEIAQDEIVIKFTSRPIAYSGGEGGIQYHCWDGGNNVQVALKGSILGAQGYQWETTGLGIFSDATIKNPIYTLSQAEITARTAEVTLTATGGTCGTIADSEADELMIILITPNTNSFINPDVAVCSGETTDYEISNTEGGSSFVWSLKYNLGVFANTQETQITSGNKATIKWIDYTTASDSISVVETDNRGCEGKPLKIGVYIHDNTNPGISSPSIFSFPKTETSVRLIENKSTDTDTRNIMEFSGSGVFSLTNGGKIEYYFNPSVVWYSPDNNTDGTNNSIVSYKYRLDIANCYSATEETLFKVYDGNQAFNLTLVDAKNGGTISIGSDDKYSLCEDQVVKITISDAFFIANPLAEDYMFKLFTIDKPKKIDLLNENIDYFTNNTGDNTSGKDNYAILDPSKLYGLKSLVDDKVKTIEFPVELEINGWQEDPNSIDPSPSGYGRIRIRINPLPNLYPDAVDKEICSNITSIALTRDVTENPLTQDRDEGGNIITFFDFFVNGDYPSYIDKEAIISGDINKGFQLNPESVFSNTTSYPTPSDIEIGYTYQDVKGCRDTMSFITSIILLPDQPIISDAKLDNEVNILCAKSGAPPKAEVGNMVSFTNPTTKEEISADIAWYKNNNLIQANRISQEASYMPTIDTEQNGVTSYYLTQEIGGCVSQARRVDYEVLNVPPPSWDKSCVDGGETMFSVDLKNINADTIKWVVNSDATSSKMLTASSSINTFAYTFEQPGQDTIIVTVESVAGCSAIRSEPIAMLKNIVFDSNQKTYKESFDITNGGFVALPALSPDITTPISTWAHGEIVKLNRPTRDEDSKVWVTSLNNPYGNGERSYLYVGCVDLSNINLPILTFDSWVNTHEGNDGVVLQYSVDNKVINDPAKIWKAIGEVGTGLEWYNKQLIESIPNNAVNNYGWSGGNGNWKESKHSLQSVKEDQEDHQAIIFRFVFASTNSPAGKFLGGFALDNFFIGEKTRIVLLENFTNKGNLNRSGDEKSQSNYIRDFLPNNIGTELVKINYHVGFPSPDPFNIDNPMGPSSRALFYGVKTTPTALLGGSKPPDILDGTSKLFSQWGPKEQAIRTLRPSQVEIQIKVNDPADEIPEGGVNVSVDITSVSERDIEGAKLYIAILEKSISKHNLPTDRQDLILTQEDVFDYVFKEMLPSPSGKHIDVLGIGGKYEFGPYTWYPKPAKIYGDNSNIAIVAFLQNENTKNIYQVAFEDDIELPLLVTAIEEKNPLDHVKIYPNPADQNINIVLPYQTQSERHLHLINPMGTQVQKTIIPVGKTTKKMNIEYLPEGVYILKIEMEQGATVHEKVIITHSDK